MIMQKTNKRSVRNWVNWDATPSCGNLNIGDFWDVVDSVDNDRKHAIMCAPAIAAIDSDRLAALENKTYDMAEFFRDEPYAQMCTKPDAGGTRRTGRNRECVRHAKEDRQIIADNRPEIERLKSQVVAWECNAHEHGWHDLAAENQRQREALEKIANYTGAPIGGGTQRMRDFAKRALAATKQETTPEVTLTNGAIENGYARNTHKPAQSGKGE